MATGKKEDVQSIPTSEYCIYDSRSGEDSEDVSSLFKSLQKFGQSCAKAAFSGLRGINLSGFTVQVYATPEQHDPSKPPALRIVFEAGGKPAPGRNLEAMQALVESARTRVSPPSS